MFLYFYIYSNVKYFNMNAKIIVLNYMNSILYNLLLYSA